MGSFSKNVACALLPLSLSLTVVACLADLTEEPQGVVAQADQCSTDGGAAVPIADAGDAGSLGGYPATLGYGYLGDDYPGYGGYGYGGLGYGGYGYGGLGYGGLGYGGLGYGGELAGYGYSGYGGDGYGYGGLGGYSGYGYGGLGGYSGYGYPGGYLGEYGYPGGYYGYPYAGLPPGAVQPQTGGCQN